MAVSGQQVSASFTSDGVTLAWSFGFYFMATSDIIVQITIGGVTTTAIANTQYTISGTPNSYGAYPSGGTLTWVSGQVPANGATFTIFRHTALIQPDHYVDNSPFPATVNESDLDRLTLITQELSASVTGFIGLLGAPPTTGTFAVGQWFIVVPPVPGAYWGFICTQASPLIWKPFAQISL